MGRSTNRHMPWRIVTTGMAVALMSCGLAACSADDRHSFFAYNDNIVSDAGDSVATNKAAHTVDPWSSASRNNEIPMDGNRAHAAVKRYQTDTVRKPQGLTGSAISDKSGGQPAIK